MTRRDCLVFAAGTLFGWFSLYGWLKFVSSAAAWK